MKTQNEIHTLLIRLFSGETTPDEKRKIEIWLGHSSENRKLYAELREIWLSSGITNNADNYQLEDAVRRFRAAIRKEKQPKSRIGTWDLLKYAAIAILILALPISYYLGSKTNHSESRMTTVSCAFGDRSNIVLPDSTVVWMNSGSKLSFDPDFRKKERTVILEGEAFFSVSKDINRPFLVKTDVIDIEVLGTSFNVKAYADENTVSTTLVEGSLKVSSISQQTKIKPYEKMVFDKGNQKMEVRKLTDTAPETEWKDGRLIFRNESLEELEPKLERWFDVDIVLADEQVKQRRFTGTLERESILEAVSYFNLSNLVECQIAGNKIIIKSEKQRK